MARTSRIAHPAGDRFLMAHFWAIRAAGKDAALVLGELDFLDRGQEKEGQPVATRQRIVADLEGIVGRNNVDKALLRLVELGWVKRFSRQVLGEKNLQTWHEFGIDPAAINAFVETAVGGNPGVPNSGSRGSPNRDRKRDASIEEEKEFPPYPPHGGGDVPLEELFMAALWQAGVEGRTVGIGWERNVKARLKGGADRNDHALWLRWRAAQKKEITHKRILDRMRDHEPDPQVIARGEENYPAMLIYPSMRNKGVRLE